MAPGTHFGHPWFKLKGFYLLVHLKLLTLSSSINLKSVFCQQKNKAGSYILFIWMILFYNLCASLALFRVGKVNSHFIMSVSFLAVGFSPHRSLHLNVLIRISSTRSSLYLNLHVAEQPVTVQQLVVLPSPAHLAYTAMPGRGWRGIRSCSA